MAAKKPSPESSDQPEPRILKKGTCPALSGKSTLTYHLGCDAKKAVHVRITENSGGGFFSQEWVALQDIQQALRGDSPVSAIRLMPLFRGQSVNTPGFLIAVLTAEKSCADALRPTDGPPLPAVTF